MFTKFIVAYTSIIALFVVGYATVVEGMATDPDCCDRRLYEDWTNTQDEEKIYKAEKMLFPEGQHRRLEPCEEDCRCSCDGDSVGPPSDCTCCGGSTLEDAIETLDKTCIKSQNTKIMKFKGVFAKTSLLLAVKLDNIFKKKAFAIKASKILGCPSTGSACYDEACGHIDSAISSIVPDRRKLEGKKDLEPKSETAELLAANPGIWAIPNFLDETDTIKLVDLLEKHRDNVGPSPCTQKSHDVRNCIYFTNNDLINTNRGEDETVFNNIRNKVQALWPQLNLLETHGVYDVPKGNADPFGYHWDPNFECTTVIFLSDNNDDKEGNVIFPFAGDSGLSVAPRKGMALTWLTKHVDGTINESHAHGIQASPDSAQLIAAFNLAWGEESSLVSPE